MKLYATRNWRGEFFITPDYDRVEHYDHKEITREDLSLTQRNDLDHYGFCVAVPNRWTGTADLERVWSERELIPAKPGKTLQQMKEEAYIADGYVMDADGKWWSKHGKAMV